MTPFKIAGKPVRIPSGWHELTVEQMQQCLSISQNEPERWKDFMLRLSVYSGLEYSELSNCTIKDEDLQLLLTCCAWEQEPVEVTSLAVPNQLRFFNEHGELVQTLRVPKVLSEERLGSKVMFMQQIVPRIDSEKSVVPSLDLALSIYFQPYFDGRPFDTTRVKEFAEVCRRCLFVEALPVANFFLKESLRWISRRRNS